MKKLLASTALLVCLVPSAAGAQIVSPSPTTDLGPLTVTISTQKTTTPTAFTNLDEIVAGVEKMDASKRGPFVPLGKSFIALGPDKSLPLAAVLIEQLNRPTVTGSARIALFVGIIESFAHHQNLDVVPLLFATIASETDPYILASASEAIGRIGTDAHILDLLTLSANDNVRSGLRGCRRVACASFLVGRYDGLKTDADKAAVAKTLGSIANVWAWQTTEVQSKDDGDAVRGIVARAMITRYKSASPNVQKSIRKAVLLADYAGTPALIEAEKSSAKGDELKALTALAKRFADNPLR